MLKVLIVDDEILARLGIKSLIPFEKHGYEIVGEAENGKQALIMARELKPDIIITDIKMPILNGIELIRTLKEEKCPSKFIVLSSYDEFNYVTEAMKLGAEDYILKLQMKVDKFLDILNKVKEKIENEQDEVRKYQEAEKQRHENIIVLREKFLRDLIFGHIISNQDIMYQLNSLKMEFQHKHYVCLVVQVDDMDVFERYSEEDMYVLNDAIINLIGEILSSENKGYVFCPKSQEFVILYSINSVFSISGVFENIQEMTNDIKWLLKKYFNLNVSIGVSNTCNNLNNIKTAYKEASKAVQSAFNYPRGSTMMFSEINHETQNANDNEDKRFSKEIKEFEKALSVVDGKKIKQAIESLKDKLIDSGSVSKEYLKGLYSNLIFLINSFVDENEFNRENIWKKDPYKQIELFTVQMDFIGWLTTVQERLTEALQEISDNKRLVVKTKQYIEKYYSGNVSLETIADYLNVSANYLSNLFKKETGENFIDYVTNIRINAAKELLIKREYKSSDIGKMVGYDNEYYFSRVFKKVVGVSPVKYRTTFLNTARDGEII